MGHYVTVVMSYDNVADCYGDLVLAGSNHDAATTVQ